MTRPIDTGMPRFLADMMGVLAFWPQKDLVEALGEAPEVAYSLYTEEEVQLNQSKQTSISDFFPKVERENGQTTGSVNSRPEEGSPEGEIQEDSLLNPHADAYQSPEATEAEVLNCSLQTADSDMTQDMSEATESISELSIEDSDISDGEPTETISITPGQATHHHQWPHPSIYNAGKAVWGPVPYHSEPLFKQGKPNLERPILMAAAEQWDYQSFEATAASQLPEHGFIEAAICLGAEMGDNPNPNPDGMHPQGAPEGATGGPDKANLMSAEAEATPTVSATTKSQSTSPGGKGATSDKADSKDSTAEALQGQEKTKGKFSTIQGLRNMQSIVWEDTQCTTTGALYASRDTCEPSQQQLNPLMT